ncbi:hypothetical protein [Filomicrobium sp.]|uniref:hypothetical protein n=1 Tax=Filomicrobium sp. TaxID=2024831 RepID=UPI00258BDADD|nr:hypothetical protein [Filomicrobium sp.]MCV0370206.1 hypothetical protein [Filomicrobium sp.]
MTLFSYRLRDFRPIWGNWHGTLSGIMPVNLLRTRSANKRRILSVPLSPEQMADLSRRAGRAPLSAFARAQLFPANDNEPAPATRTRRAAPVRDDAALAEILAKLGKTDVGSGLREMARLARIGALPVTPETESDIQRACRDVGEIKALLMKALGIRER